MASIPANVILVWTSTNASIPSGWSRETTLDDKFAKGWGDAVAPNEIGGAATHTHTSPAHSHNLSAHTHTYQTSAASAGNISGRSAAAGVIRGTHYHTGTTGALSSTYATSSDAGTYGAVSNDPPYRKVIFIKASAGAQLATNIVALWGASDTAPTNWSKVTELDGRYLKGAGTGADSDLTTDSGSSTNIHDFTHGHTAPSAHAHGNSTSSTATAGGFAEETSGGERVNNHTHTVAVNTATPDINQFASTLTTVETVEPVYRRLHAIKKGASGLKVANIIGMWLGASTSIPSGWSLYTAMKDKHLKIGDPTTSATGGANTHTHAAQGHVHTGTAHTHTHASISNHTGDRTPTGVTNSSDLLYTGIEHSGNTVANANTAYDSANTTADSSSNEPAYRTVAFIRFDKESGGGSFIFNLI